MESRKSISIILLFMLMFTSMRMQAQKQYFQQKLNYKIDVLLDESENQLHGNMSLNYQNNSPDTLRFIYFHFWPNAYSSDQTPFVEQQLLNQDDDFYFAHDDKFGFMDSLHFTIKEKEAQLIFMDKAHEIGKVILPKPLLPKDRISLQCTFRVQVPQGSYSRMGHSNGCFQISQWYPKPAVYDAKGWHSMPYLDQGEFYGEFGSFTVNILAKADQTIAASGNIIPLSTEEKNKVIALFPQRDLNLEYKVERYHLEQCHDFAWFANPQFVYKKRKIKLDNGHEVLLQAYYPMGSSRAWNNALNYLENSVRFYSQEVGHYPYDVCSAVEGPLSAGGGMEYPTITIIGEYWDPKTIELTIMHEVGHNWFYGILGFNERDYPWMDEGLNNSYQPLYETKYFAKDHPLNSLLGNLDFISKKADTLDSYYLSYLMSASRHQDQAQNLKSQDYSAYNYGSIIYYKSTMIFQFLRDYLGAEEYRNLMHEFFNKWKFKHPQPEDFKAFFIEHAKKDVEWFFQNLMENRTYIDYGIRKIRTLQDSTLVRIKNYGDSKSYFKIRALNDKAEIIDEFWLAGFDGTKEVYIKGSDVSKVVIDPQLKMPDINRGNNVRSVHWTKNFPKFKFLGSTPIQGEKIIYFTPTLAWNHYNKSMLGLALYNNPIFEKKWQYLIAPMYSFKRFNWNGQAMILRNFYLKGKFQKLSLSYQFKKYAYDFQNAATDFDYNPYLNFMQNKFESKLYFQSPKNNPAILQYLSYRYYQIEREYLAWPLDATPPIIAQVENITTSMHQLEWHYSNKSIVNPYDFGAQLEMNTEVGKISSFANYSLSLAPKKSIDLHFFGGGFLYNNTDGSNINPYYFKMSSYSGSDDYLFDLPYAARNQAIGSGVYAQQMYNVEGNFVIQTPLGNSWKWIGNVGIHSSLPIVNFIKAFAHFGIYPDYLTNKATFLYEGGLYFNFFGDGFQLYFPFLWSQEIQDVEILNNREAYKNKIRFQMRLDLTNPIKRFNEIQY